MPTVDQWASSPGLVLSLGAAQSWPILLPDTTRHCSRAHVLFSKYTDALSSTNPTWVWLSCDFWVDLYHWFQLSHNFSKTAYRKLDIRHVQIQNHVYEFGYNYTRITCSHSHLMIVSKILKREEIFSFNKYRCISQTIWNAPLPEVHIVQFYGVLTINFYTGIKTVNRIACHNIHISFRCHFRFIAMWNSGNVKFADKIADR